MRLNPESLAKASSHHPWRTLTVWLVVLVLAGVSSALLLSGGLTTNFDFTNNPEAKQAKTIVDDAFPGAKAIHETWVVTTDRRRERCGVRADHEHDPHEDQRAGGHGRHRRSQRPTRPPPPP